MLRFRNSIPFSRDISATADFYCGLLGLEPVERYDHWLMLQGGLAFHDGDTLHQAVFDENGDGSDWGRRNLVIYFVARDLEETFARVSAQARILHDIKDVPHGERLFRCLDPDGHVVEIGDGAHLAENDR